MSDYFSSILHLHTKELTPIKNRISLGRHLQMPMFNQENRSHLNMGLFYELLSAGLFGGDLVDSITKIEGQSYVGCKPDIKSKRKKTFIESKAIRQGHQLNLLDDQISKYLGLQIVYPEYDINFAIWRHGIKGIKSLSLSYIEVLKVLSTKTLSCTVLPMSVIDQIHKNLSGRSKRYENNPVWYDCTRISSLLLNKFILNPESALSTFVNGYQYTWKRYITPKDMFVEGIKVEPIPVIVFKDKNDKWKKDLLSFVPF